MVSRAYSVSQAKKKKDAQKSGITPDWNRKYGPGSNAMAVYKPGSTKAVPNRPADTRNYAAELGAWANAQGISGGPQPPTSSSMGSMYGGNNRGGGRSYGYGRGGGGGGGGGPAGPSAAQLAAVNKAFTLNESPYWMMQAALDNQRRQAAAYNPNFAGMEQTALASGRRYQGERDALMAQQQAGLTQLGQTLANQQGQG